MTPTLGAASATSINKVTVTAPATGSTLTIEDGKTLAASNSLTLAGTDSTTLTFQGTDTYVGRTTTDTLTNKTLTAPSMTDAFGTAIRWKLSDQGTCTMTSGACAAQNLATAYAAAPVCVLTWTGTGALAGVLKVASTTTTVTPTSSNGADTAHVNYACFGN